MRPQIRTHVGILATYRQIASFTFGPGTTGESIKVYRNGGLVATATSSSPYVMSLGVKETASLPLVHVIPVVLSQPIAPTVVAPTVIDLVSNLRLTREMFTIPSETVTPIVPVILAADTPVVTKRAALLITLTESVSPAATPPTVVDTPTKVYPP